jgi:ABC-type transporter Mla maintaining outer membrane lipid asymmetry permease subunit MlaE
MKIFIIKILLAFFLSGILGFASGYIFSTKKQNIFWSDNKTSYIKTTNHFNMQTAVMSGVISFFIMGAMISVFELRKEKMKNKAGN